MKLRITSVLVLLSTGAVQGSLGKLLNGGTKRQETDINDFITSETTIALDGVLCNIGSTGCHAAGVAPGVVIAAIDHETPPYFFSWTRDSALTFKALVDRFIDSFDYNLQSLIHEYITAGAKIQGVSNPSGGLSDGSGLGEAKFNVDISAFTGAWGRPQRDGPALRAIAMMTYGSWLMDNGYNSTAANIIWPIVRNDLNYVAQYWNQTGFDLWEEVKGSSFFATANQYRALVQGAAFANSLDQPTTSYANVAPQILCFLQSFWVSSGGYIVSNINLESNNGRTGKDSDSILASIATFDPKLNCDAATFQPCSDKMLANHKALVDSFRFYKINSGIAEGQGIAIGRYAEDVFYNGNPWYLATLAAAEIIYDAIYVWKQQTSVNVTSTSLPFFQDLVPGIQIGVYSLNQGSSSYNDILNAASAYADSFVGIVEKYQGANGALSEEFSKDNGTPLSAHDLTWSYASFLTAAARRAGKVPTSWAPNADSGGIPIPSSCKPTTVQGTYSSATSTSWPATLTPKTGAPPPPTSTTPSCPSVTSVAVTFQEQVVTVPGQTIKIVGNTTELAGWDTSKAVPLDANLYGDNNPIWEVTINLPVGQAVLYKYINVDSNGGVTWEGDPNRAYTVPDDCATMAFVRSTWQS